MQKKSISLRLLSAVLAAVLLIGTLAVSSSAEPAAYVNPNGCTKAHPCDYSPTIIVPGINQSVTYLYEDGEKTDLGGGTIFPTTDVDFLPVIFSALFSLLSQHDIFLTKSIYNLMSQMFEPQRVDSNGKYVHDLRTEPIGRVSEMTDDQRHTALDVNVPVYSLIDIVGEDHVYFFSFNLVDEIWNSVDELEKYIDFVRKETGHDKVNLVNVSLGGTVFTGYIEKYGHSKLDQVANVVATTDGSEMFADLFTHKVNRADDFLYEKWLPDLLEKDIHLSTGYDRSIGYLADLVIRLFPNKLFENVISAAWQGILDTVVLNCTQFWALVPCDRYDEAAAMHLGKKPTLKAKTDSYHQAQLNLADNVRAAVADGVCINNFAGSNLSFGDNEYTYFQVVASRGKVNSDGIIALAGATMDATGAAPGDAVLPTPTNTKYFSPDKKIDCSTCVLPDNTWVFLNQPHEVGRNDAVLNVAAKVMTTPGMNVNTDPEHYPQFNYAMNTNELRRGRLGDAERLLKEGNLSAADKAELQAAIDEGYAVRALTVGDAERAQKATDAVKALLVKHSAMGAPFEQSKGQVFLEKVTKALSEFALAIYGNNGYSDGINCRRIWKSIFA
ncbi:MAG: alpha/beta hydrolase [Oscillospiraceae bacterium]|nr:alpha/beta hydrolase [Oscillospiraceae bacterium]